VIGVTTGVGGGQVVLGLGGASTSITSVFNPSNSFRERFNFTNFEDTVTTTADWGSGSLDFTTGEIAESLSVVLGQGTISLATITINLTSGVIGDLSIELSADGGVTYESVTNAVEHAFTVAGADLRFRITASGTVTSDFIRVDYT